MTDPGRNPSRYTPQAALVMALLALIVAPVLYVLSFGPMAWIADRTGGAWYDTLYAPLNWLYEHVPATQPWFQWYLSLWIDE